MTDTTVTALVTASAIGIPAFFTGFEGVLPPSRRVIMLTRPTGATPFRPDGVGFIKSVPVNTMSLPCALRANRFSSQDVFPARNRFQMQRVYTGMRSTEMIESQPVGNGANHSFVGPAVCSNDATATVTPKVEPPVIVAVKAGSPHPAGAKIGPARRDWPLFIYLCPETVGRVTNAPGFCRSTGRAEVGAEPLALKSLNAAPFSRKWRVAIFTVFGNLSNSQGVSPQPRRWATYHGNPTMRAGR